MSLDRKFNDAVVCFESRVRSSIPAYNNFFSIALGLSAASLLFLASIGTATFCLGGLMAFGDFGSLAERVVPALYVAGFVIAFGAYGTHRFRRTVLLLTGIVLAAAMIVGQAAWENGEHLLLLLIVLGLHGCWCLGYLAAKRADQLTSPEWWAERRLNDLKCPVCEYSIAHLPQPRCPECGTHWGISNADNPVAADRPGNDCDNAPSEAKSEQREG